MTTTEYTISGTEHRVTYASRLHKAGRYGVLFGMERGGTPANEMVSTVGDLPRRLALDHGVVMTSSAPSGYSYGNDASIAALTSARSQQLHTTLGCRTDKVILFGRSMGGCQVLNWARQNLSVVKCIALVCPLINLVDAHDRVFEAEVDTAYGSHAAYLAGLVTHNPTQYAASLAGIPMRIWYSTNDTSILQAHVLAFAAAVGSSCSVVSMGAVGHTVTAAPPEDVAQWISAQL